MAVFAKCPYCNRKWGFPDRAAGKRVRCAGCKAAFVAVNTGEQNEPPNDPVGEFFVKHWQFLTGVGVLMVTLFIVSLWVVAGRRKEPEVKGPSKEAVSLALAKELPKDSPPKDIAKAVPLRSDHVPTNMAYPQTAQEVAKTAFGSTVLLVMQDANGQPFSLGSGFFVRESEIASNLHVVAGALAGSAKLVGRKTKYDIEGITAIDPERDLVVLKVTAAGSPTLAIGSSDAVQVGETVYAVGNPQGLEGTFSQGVVSSIREVGSDQLLQITAPISPGSSGGPVLNGKGQVIGVSVATFRGGQNLNFAIPSRYLKALLAKAGPVKPLAQAKPPTAQRVMWADLGGRSSEGVVGAQFTWALPGNSFSGSYSFSLRNQLRQQVKNVYCLVVFRDDKGQPVDVAPVRFSSVIPAGLARRVTPLPVDSSVGKLTKWRDSAVEFRILDFEIVD